LHVANPFFQYEQSPLCPYLLAALTSIGKCLSYFASGLATAGTKFNSLRVWIASFIPPNVAVCLDYVFSCAVIKFFFGNDIVDSLLTMLVGNIIRFIIVRVEQIVCGLVQMVRGCKCKTRCSGATSSLSWIIVSFLLLAMVGPVAVSLLKETTPLLSLLF